MSIEVEGISKRFGSWADPVGSPSERRVYVVVGIILWLAMLALPGCVRLAGVDRDCPGVSFPGSGNHRNSFTRP